MSLAHFVLLSLIAAVGSSGQAPAAPLSVSPATPVTITFEHEGRDTTGYALYAIPETGNELRIDLGPARPDRRGRVRITMPHLPTGAYQLALVAYNAAGESARIATTPAAVRIEAAAPARPITAASPAATPARRPQPSHAPAAAPTARRGLLDRIWRIVFGSDDH